MESEHLIWGVLLVITIAALIIHVLDKKYPYDSKPSKYLEDPKYAEPVPFIPWNMVRPIEEYFPPKLESGEPVKFSGCYVYNLGNNAHSREDKNMEFSKRWIAFATNTNKDGDLSLLATSSGLKETKAEALLWGHNQITNSHTKKVLVFHADSLVQYREAPVAIHDLHDPVKAENARVDLGTQATLAEFRRHNGQLDDNF